MLASAVFILFTVVAVVLGLALYFLPTIIAQQRKHASLGGIFALNFLLGWSLLGWIGALVWAMSNPQPVVVVQNVPGYLPPGYAPPAYPQQPVYPPQAGYPQQPAYPPAPVLSQQAAPAYGAAVHPVPDAVAQPTEYIAEPAVVLTPVHPVAPEPPSDPTHL